MLGSDMAQVEQSGLHVKKKRTTPIWNSTTESSQKGSEGDRERARGYNFITQHKVGSKGRAGMRQCCGHYRKAIMVLVSYRRRS